MLVSEVHEPRFSLLPFPSDASSSPSSCLHPSRKQHSPVCFSRYRRHFADLHHPLQPEQPQHFQSVLEGLRPLRGFGCPSWYLLYLHCPPQDNEKKEKKKKPKPLITTPSRCSLGQDLSSSHGQPHTVKNLAAGQSSQMLLPEISSAPCSFGKGKTLA